MTYTLTLADGTRIEGLNVASARKRIWDGVVTDESGHEMAAKGKRLVRKPKGKQLTEAQKAKLLDARVQDMATHHEREQAAAREMTRDEKVAELEDLGDYSRSYDVYGHPLDPMVASKIS